eukprot:8914586-Pyramimonas_sp.AAC.1
MKVSWLQSSSPFNWIRWKLINGLLDEVLGVEDCFFGTAHVRWACPKAVKVVLHGCSTPGTSR